MNIYFKTLVLNADYKPLSYFPLSVWDWKDTIKAVFLEKVSVVSEYNEIARSPSLSIKIPSVIALKQFVVCSKKPAFTRFNVLFPFDVLHPEHAVITFSQIVFPP